MDNGNSMIGGAQNSNQTTPAISSAPQQTIGQPIMDQQVVMNPTITNTPAGGGQNNKKKRNLIIGCVTGGAVLAALMVVLLVIFLQKNGEKTVACTMNTTTMGITITGETNVQVKDGEISSGDMTINVNLKTMRDSYKDHEKEMVDKLTDQHKRHCEEHCVFDYSYTEGDNVKYTMQYDGEGVSEIVWSYGTDNMSAQEIADKVQETLEDSETTCRQY